MNTFVRNLMFATLFLTIKVFWKSAFKAYELIPQMFSAVTAAVIVLQFSFLSPQTELELEKNTSTFS